MTWNYRVLEFTDSENGSWQAIHEVHYDAAGRPSLYTEEPSPVLAIDDGGNEACGGVRWVLDQMRDALDKPVLRECDFDGEPPQ